MANEDQLFAKFGQACPAGTVLFHEGESGNSMYVVQSGRVAITKRFKGGDKTLAVLGPGEFLGEMAILNSKPRNATAQVVEEARLLLIDARTFELMIVDNSEIAVRLIKRLARRLDAANALIEVMMHRDPKARLILGLSRQAQIIGEARDDGAVVVPLSDEELAGELGLTATEVGEVVKRLARLRILERQPDGIVILDQVRLHDFLEFLELREQGQQDS
jgi:CRP-like cAMP-binding protein